MEGPGPDQVSTQSPAPPASSAITASIARPLSIFAHPFKQNSEVCSCVLNQSSKQNQIKMFVKVREYQRK